MLLWLSRSVASAPHLHGDYKSLAQHALAQYLVAALAAVVLATAITAVITAVIAAVITVARSGLA